MAAQLTVLPAIDPAADPEKAHARRCPQCGTFYRYLQSHEYMMNGTEDEEELTRMSPAQANAFCLEQAKLLESLRCEIDDLQGAAGGLGDYIDRGRPSPAEAQEAFDSMERQRAEAGRLRARLQGLVEALRRDGPEILAAWADAHARACRSLLLTLPDQSDDDKTARFVARATLEAWEKFPAGGETFIGISLPWLEGYQVLLEQQLADGRREEKAKGKSKKAKVRK